MPYPYVTDMSTQGVSLHVFPEPGRSLESAQEAAREALARLDDLIAISDAPIAPKIALERNGPREKTWTYSDEASGLAAKLYVDWDLVRLVIEKDQRPCLLDIDGRVSRGTHQTFASIARFFSSALQAVLAPEPGKQAYEALRKEALVEVLGSGDSVTMEAPYPWGTEPQEGPGAAHITCTYCSPGVSVTIHPLLVTLRPGEISPIEALRLLGKPPAST